MENPQEQSDFIERQIRTARGCLQSWIGISALVALVVALLVCAFQAYAGITTRRDTPTELPTETLSEQATETVAPPTEDEPTETATSTQTEEPEETEAFTETAPPPTEIVTEPPTETELPTEASCACEGTTYVCPDHTEFNSLTCGGTGKCICEGSTLTCPDGTYAEFNPQCLDGYNPACETAVCGDGNCQMECGETYPACQECG